MAKPTTIILFGITGDLAQKKLLPALFDMYKNGELDNSRIVGFSRRKFSKEEIDAFVGEIFKDKDFDPTFLTLLSYVSGEFNDETAYTELSKYLLEVTDKELGACSNKLFYLSTPPDLYEVICKNISASGLSIPCGGEDGFARILIEKPFGKNLKTAIELDALLGKLFKEEQIYRIDHYLAKESLMNILNVHRKDDAHKHRWNKEHIERIEIDIFETAVVGKRGASYDGVGALRDVGQNHMLQMLALIAMDIPEDLSPSSIQTERAKALEEIIPPTLEDLQKIHRGQYEGYRSEPGVDPNSTTETLFSLELYLKKESVAGVPFVLRFGKALSQKKSCIDIKFKDGSNLFIPVNEIGENQAYKKILQDCINGDQTVFISTREINAEWKYITPILEETMKKEPFIYTVGSNPENIFK